MPVELAISAGQESLRSDLLGTLATKADLNDLKSEIAELKSDLKGDIARLEADFHKTMTGQTWRVVGFVVAGTAFVQGLMKFLA